MRIKELIVVEGKNDLNKLNSILDGDIIITSGSHLSNKTMELIKHASNSRGVIIFTDPDKQGEKIRALINEKIPNCKNAFLPKDKAIGHNKIGIEHACKEDILQALNNLISYDSNTNSLSIIDYNSLELSGYPNSTMKRQIICNHYKINFCNAKTLYKRLNYMRVTKKDLIKIL